MNDEPHVPKMTLRRLVATAFILLVVFFDIVTTTNLMRWRARIPQPRAVYKALAMFRVFDTWSDKNQAYTVELRVRRPDQDPWDATWESFDLRPFYPDPPNDRRVRIYRSLRDPEQFCKEIERLYLMDHSNLVVEEIAVFNLHWPKSSISFEHGIDEAVKQSIHRKLKGQPVLSAGK